MGDRSLIHPCAPCRRGPPLGLITPDQAINLHATRSASERRAGADLIGGSAISDDVVILVLQDNSTHAGPFPPPSDDWGIVFVVAGDLSARYPAGTHTIEYGPVGPTNLPGLGVLGSQSRISACGGLFAAECTRFNHTAAVADDPGDPGDPITITLTEEGGASILDRWSNIPLCHMTPAAGLDPDIYYYKSPNT